MITKHENPPAFPLPIVFYPNGHVAERGQDGMTLRDWFAGKSITGIRGAESSDRFAALSADQAARQAYADADAMLAAREAK